MSLLKSIATVGGFTLLSRLIGFARDILIAAFLGASMAADAFFVAWRFPNLFRSLFAEGTVNVSFVPLFTEKLRKEDKPQAEQFASEAFSFLFYLLLIFVLCMEIFMPQAAFIMAPGFNQIPDKLALTCYLSRITFPFLIFVSLVSLLAGVLNSVGKFAAAAFTPCILNIVMIVCLFTLTPITHAPAESLAFGVLTAGVFELGFLYVCVKKSGFCVRLLSPMTVIQHFSRSLKKLLTRMLPGIVGSGVYQINLFFDTFLVSFVGAGAMSWLNYAHHLFQLPVGMIGVAIGTVLLPMLSHYVAQGKIKEAVYDLNRGLEVSLVVSVASMFGLICLSSPIVSVLFERGAFTHQSVLPTAMALKAYAIGLPAYMLTKALSQLFYAKGDTKTPVRIALYGMFINVSLSLFLMQFLGYVGIALATGITVWVNAVQYMYLLYQQGDFHFDRLFSYRLVRIIVSALLMCVFLLLGDSILTLTLGDWIRWHKIWSVALLACLIICAGVIYLLTLILTKGILIKDVHEFLIRKKRDVK